MAKNRGKQRSRRPGIKIPLAVVAGFMPAVGAIMAEAKASGWTRALQVQVPKSILMYNPDPTASPKWGFAYANQGFGGIVAGLVVHNVLGTRLGLNRALGRMGVPLLRI